jgi:hypothetical protein
VTSELNAQSQIKSRSSARSLNSTHRSKQYRGAQLMPCAPCTIPADCMTELSLPYELNAPSLTNKARSSACPRNSAPCTGLNNYNELSISPLIMNRPQPLTKLNMPSDPNPPSQTIWRSSPRFLCSMIRLKRLHDGAQRDLSTQCTVPNQSTELSVTSELCSTHRPKLLHGAQRGL